MKYYYENHDFELTVFEEENFNFPFAHWHTKVEIAFVIEGSIIIGVNNEKKLFYKGDAVVLGSGDIHYYDGRNLNAKILLLIFKPELINAFGSWPENKRFQSNYISKDLMDTTELKQLIPLTYLIKDEFRKEEEASELLIKGYLFTICGLLYRCLSTIELNDKLRDKVLLKLKLLQDIFEYIELNYMNDITVESISKKFGISPKFFSKIFNSISSINFKTHLNTIRIARAEVMIREGEKNLTEISFECGFNSVRTFNRAYKALRGTVPSSFKKC